MGISLEVTAYPKNLTIFAVVAIFRGTVDSFLDGLGYSGCWASWIGNIPGYSCIASQGTTSF